MQMEKNDRHRSTVDNSKEHRRRTENYMGNEEKKQAAGKEGNSIAGRSK